MPFRLGALRAFLALAAVMLAAAPSHAIDGGSLATRTGLSQAAVGIGTLVAGSEGAGVSRCSGVLIAADLVLTAGHCVQDGTLASAVVLYDGSRPVRPAIPVAALARYDAVPDDLPSDLSGLVQLSLDTAVLRLATPVRGRKPVRVAHGLPPRNLLLAGAGLSQQGVGVLKTARLEPLMITSTGLIIAQAQGSEVCKGDSGGPVVTAGREGPVLWGVASAVLSRDGACGRVVIVAPAHPHV